MGDMSSYRREDRDSIFVTIWLDLGVLFSLSTSASSLFESHSVFFVVDIIAEIGEGGTRGCVIIFVARFVGGGRSMNLRGGEGLGEGVVFVQGSSTEPSVDDGEGGHGGSCHDGADKGVHRVD